MGDGLYVTRLDIQFALYDFGGSEGTDLRLVTVDSGQEVVACLMQEISYSLHILLVWRLIVLGYDGLDFAVLAAEQAEDG